MSTFENAAVAALPGIGVTSLRTVAERLLDGWPDHAVLDGLGNELAGVVGPVLDTRRSAGVPRAEAAAFLRGLAGASERLASAVTVETVWSGPNSHAVPVRATAQALVEVVDEARSELVLMTYSAKPHEPIRHALESAVSRGVSVTIVVETLQGAGGALAGSEPASAFTSVGGVRLWHWPAAQRHEPAAKMHAKVAIADRRVLLVSSANLTQSGVAKNVEAGLLVRGGVAPQRAAEHVAELQTRGVLTRLRTGEP